MQQRPSPPSCAPITSPMDRSAKAKPKLNPTPSCAPITSPMERCLQATRTFCYKNVFATPANYHSFITFSKCIRNIHLLLRISTNYRPFYYIFYSYSIFVLILFLFVFIFKQKYLSVDRYGCFILILFLFVFNFE